MRALVIGSGGREHAVVEALRRDPDVMDVHAAPGNPGMGSIAELHPLAATDGAAAAELARQLSADLVVVGPELPLMTGVADAVRNRGIPCFGPSAEAAVIEGSKAFAKDVMRAAGIPTATAVVCERAADVQAALDQFGPPYVVKDDGLAAGKGVLVTSDRVAAVAHAAACGKVVIEEYLDGPELSLFGICDGEIVLPMQPAQDFKRLRDRDEGPNTGGMGAYTPLPWVSSDLRDEVTARVLRPAAVELAKRGMPFSGLLYAGLALTSSGVKVVEFNARFGDPETQALLAVLDTPLGGLLHAAATGGLSGVPALLWSSDAAVTVVAAAAGYPEAPMTGALISGVEAAEALGVVSVHHAGTTLTSGGQLCVAGGRVLAVTAKGSDLQEARRGAYNGIEQIFFEGMQVRRDIALRTTAVQS